jgi:hypothetical protein
VSHEYEFRIIRFTFASDWAMILRDSPYVLWLEATSNWHLATGKNGDQKSRGIWAEKEAKSGIDCLMTVLSNRVSLLFATKEL